MTIVRINGISPTNLEIMGVEPSGSEERAKQYTDQKISELPAMQTPTLAELGGEPAGAEVRSKQYTDLKISEIPLPPLPTLESLGAEPAGARAYTDQKILALPPTPTLASLGGEPSGAESRARAYTDQKLSELVARLNQLEADYPQNHSHFWGLGNAYNGAAQKTWTRSVSGNNEFARFAVLTNAANNDTVDYKFPLKAGTYTLEVVHLRRTDGAIATLYLDGNQVGSIDTYNSSTTNVNRFTANVSVSTTGTHTFKAVVTGRNASSTGFAFPVSAVLLYPAPTAPAISLILINAGDQSSYTATDGRVWQPDQYFTGGVRTDLEAALGPFTVTNTQNQRIYKFERGQDNGTFTYNIPIGTPGTFTLKLLFAENYHSSAGQRVGSVTLNGNTLLSNFDIFTRAGGKNIALVEVWNNIAVNVNTVTLAFTNTLVNGIELVRTA